MEMLAREALDTLLTPPTGPCVSLFMSTHRVPSEYEQDTIRYRNCLREARDQLIAAGMRSPEVEALLAPAVGLLEAGAISTHGGDGIAVYAAPEAFHPYALPMGVAEQVVVGSRFYLRPVLPALTGDGQFFVLAVSQNEVRLLRGSRDLVHEIALPPEVPTSLAEVVKYDDPSREMGLYSGSQRQSTGQGASIFFGKGAAADFEKDAILRFCQRIDRGLQPWLARQRAPLILAGVEPLLSLYREANTYAHLLPDSVVGSSDSVRVSDEELHAGAWAIVEPAFYEERQQAMDEFAQLIGTGRASADATEIVREAMYGRVAVLFLATDGQCWGRVDADTGTVEVHEASAPDDDDLLDLAAIHTLRNDGTAYAVEPDEMPVAAAAAATFRY